MGQIWNCHNKLPILLSTLGAKTVIAGNATGLFFRVIVYFKDPYNFFTTTKIHRCQNIVINSTNTIIIILSILARKISKAHFFLNNIHFSCSNTKIQLVRFFVINPGLLYRE